MTLTRKQPKQRKCKVCKELFTPRLQMACVCSPECAASLAKAKRAKAEKVQQVKERQAVKAKLEGMRGNGWWVAEAQAMADQWGGEFQRNFVLFGDAA